MWETNSKIRQKTSLHREGCIRPPPTKGEGRSVSLGILGELVFGPSLEFYSHMSFAGKKTFRKITVLRGYELSTATGFF